MYTLILVFFTVFLKKRNIISKIKRSKVTDYAALTGIILVQRMFHSGQTRTKLWIFWEKFLANS